MLYSFEHLANKLTALGYPETQERGFRIIRRDLTVEEQEGNVDFRSDGIYLSLDGQEYKGYMYLKYPDIERYGYPKFHITNCETILNQRSSGRFDGRYFWHNSNTVEIEDRKSGQNYENVVLVLCRYCANQSGITQYSNTEGFFGLLDQIEVEEINHDIEVDIFGYPLDWQTISREYKKEKDYKCEHCGIQIEIIGDRRFIHVHHKNGDKLLNRRGNLECLCVLCHAHKNEAHAHNFDRRRMKADIKAFISKYEEILKEIKNEFFI